MDFTTRQMDPSVALLTYREIGVKPIYTMRKLYLDIKDILLLNVDALGLDALSWCKCEKLLSKEGRQCVNSSPF